MTVESNKIGNTTLIRIVRADVRNAVDLETAAALAQAFRDFDGDPQTHVAILTGSAGHFCAGADLKAVAKGQGNRLAKEGDGPMGPTRMQLTKPVIAAIDGYCLAGGLELALWCDMRVASHRAVFGVACRRWGVPLIDGGTLRLPRLIGESRAMDLVLTGRNVEAQEAYDMGLVNRLCSAEDLMDHALELAKTLGSFPQNCLRADRISLKQGHHLSENAALAEEFERGLAVIESGESKGGAQRFAKGAGRGGSWDASS